MAPDLSDDQLHAFLEAGLSQREITRRTGIPRSTLQKRLKCLDLQVTPPGQPPMSSVDIGAVQAFDTGPVQRLDALEQEVQGLRLLMQSVLDRLGQPEVSAPVQITTLPPWPKGEAVRWNLWLPKSIRDELTTWARE